MRLDKDVWRPGLLLAGVLLLGSTGAAPADAETRVHSQQPRYARFDEQLSTLIDRVLAGHPDSETWEHRAGALF